jgi:hypothetical protein
MSGFRQQLFHQFVVNGVTNCIESFKTQYEAKRENRFHLDGITYEVSAPSISGDAIELEISSKIPQDDLDRDEFTSYFTAIGEFLASDARRPEDMDMQNIVQQGADGEATKERDYVRLRYRYGFEEMYDNDAVAERIAAVQKDPEAYSLPNIPNVNTLAGRVVLSCVEDFMRQEAMERMQRLIEANQEVRQTFGKAAPARAKGGKKK